MAVAWLLIAAALATEPAADTDPQTLEVHDVEEMAPADIAATLRSLQEELQAQRAELRALRAAPPPVPTKPTVEAGQPLIIPEGRETSDVVGIGQDVHVHGHVMGTVTAFGSSVHVFPTGRVDGDAVAVGGSIRIDDGGRLLGDRLAVGGGETQAVAVPSTWPSVWASLVRRLVFFLSFAGAGVLVLGLFPDRVTRVSRRIAHRPVRSLVSGTVGGSVLLLGALVFAVTVIGLPISVLLIAVFGLAWLLGFVGLCQAVGDRLNLNNRVHGRWLVFLAGSGFITIFGLLPFIGAATLTLTTILGMGAALSTRLGSRR